MSAVSLTCGRTWVREQRALLPAGADDAPRPVSQAGGKLSEDERARAQQLLTQTAPVTVRKHFYRTEVYQVQDCLLACDEKVMDVNSAVALGGAAAVMQTTGARCGMLTTDSYDADADSVIWCDQHPLRVRDVRYGLRELMVEGASGEFEATSHLQINWRRVKRKYFEVYFFRSAQPEPPPPPPPSTRTSPPTTT